MNLKRRVPQRYVELHLIAACIGFFVTSQAFAIQVNDAFSGQRFDGGFFSVNLATGAATQIGPNNVLGLAANEAFFDLEFGPDGKLYGLTSSRLLRVDPVTGTPTTVGIHGLTGSGGDLALDQDGTMFGVLDNKLFTVNLSTGAATLRGTNALTLMTGLVFAPNGTLYVTESTSGDDALYTLNKLNGANLGLIGTLGAIGSQGLDVDSHGTVYMIDDFVNQLFTLNLSNAAKTLVGSTLTTRLQALAIYVVPEPSALVVSIIGTLMLSGSRRCRRRPQRILACW